MQRILRTLSSGTSFWFECLSQCVVSQVVENVKSRVVSEALDDKSVGPSS